MAEKPEDLSLPASVVARIIKDALPDGVSVSKEARIAIGKAASVFILYCTACSNNFALQAKRKTLAASDVLSALNDMEFEHFVPELKTFLETYKQDQKGKRVAAADRRKQKAVAAQTAANEIQTSSFSTVFAIPSSSQSSSISDSNIPVAAGSPPRDSGGSGGVAVSGAGREGVGGRATQQEEAMDTDAVVVGVGRGGVGGGGGGVEATMS